MKTEKQKIKLTDIKQALLDDSFRQSLPEELVPEVQKFLQNPGCACNHPLYKKIAKIAWEQLKQYFPTKEHSEPEIETPHSNYWTVINCSINDLATKLRNLPHGRKQVEIARWEDQVTVIINELDIPPDKL